MMTDKGYISKPLEFEELSPDRMLEASRVFRKTIARRRSVRAFSERRVNREIIDNAIRAAGSAPSGANKQPWHFVVVSDPDIKRSIREAAELEEQAFYEERAPDAWLKDLEKLGTDADKPFLEEAPYLIAVFLERYARDKKGETRKNYYMQESVGIACGVLLTALHLSGLATLTHTPSPMDFLGEILDRPNNERPFLLVVAGYPKAGVEVPDIQRKSLDEITSYFE